MDSSARASAVPLLRKRSITQLGESCRRQSSRQPRSGSCDSPSHARCERGFSTSTWYRWRQQALWVALARGPDNSAAVSHFINCIMNRWSSLSSRPQSRHLTATHRYPRVAIPSTSTMNGIAQRTHVVASGPDESAAERMMWQSMRQRIASVRQSIAAFPMLPRRQMSDCAAQRDTHASNQSPYGRLSSERTTKPTEQTSAIQAAPIRIIAHGTATSAALPALSAAPSSGDVSAAIVTAPPSRA
jgi:hypothetical protein